MSQRTRKLIGMVALLAFIAAYAVAVMAFAVDVVGEFNKLVEIIFYVVAGVVWIVPARYIIGWMERPD